MTESRAAQDAGEPIMEEPEAALERMYIEEYLLGRGHTLQSLQTLPEEEARQLMIEASSYASTRLAEVETRAHLVEEIHGSTPSLL